VLTSAAHAAPIELYPLDKVTRGQTGYGMTAFAGSTPTKFTIEVVSVVKNFLPKQDIILIKSDDPKLAVTGIWRGMSGSPVFIDDKLVCAISYAWAFNKTTLGGCTPIEYMRTEADTYRRRPVIGNGPGPKTLAPAVSSTMAEWRTMFPGGDIAPLFDTARRENWLLSSPLPAPTRPAYQDPQFSAAIPMAVGGFSAPAFDKLSSLFANSNIVPMRGGGTSTAAVKGGPTQLQMGTSISVEFIRGDFVAAATGTVTLIEGDRVLAFGHPMVMMGEFYAPVSTVNVHTIVSSAQFAFVMGSPVNEVGALVQDRQSMIMADTGLRTPMIPIDFAVSITSGKHVQKGTFHTKVLDDKVLTPELAGTSLMNAINYYLPDRDHVTARIDSTVRFKGGEPITFTDYAYANNGAVSVIGGVRGLRALATLLGNPFSPVRIESLDFKVDLRFESNYGELKEIRIPTTELVPGQRNLVEVRMTTYDGSDIFEKIPVDVPMSLAGGIVQLEISAGGSAKLDAPPPVDLPTLVATFKKMLSGNVWAVTLSPADEGIAIDGKVVQDLPPSAQDKLRPQSRTQRATTYQALARTVAPANRVVVGSSTMLVKVRAR
jgi:hypothetical protein